MHPLAVFLATLSAVTHAWRELQTKQAHDKQIFVWWFGLAALIMYFPFFLYFLVTTGLTAAAVQFVVLSGVVHCFYWFFLSKAYEEGDLSHVYPIIRSSSALVLLFAVMFLGEVVSLQGVIGILIILVGIYLIHMRTLSWSGFIEPFRSLRELPTQYALLTAVTVAAYSITDKLGVVHMHPVMFAYLITVFVMIFNSFYIFIVKERHLIWGEWRKHPGMIISNGFLTIFSYLLILYALTFERASYVVSLRQLSIVFGVLLGGHLLKEKHRSVRFAAAGTILLGAVLISTAQ